MTIPRRPSPGIRRLGARALVRGAAALLLAGALPAVALRAQDAPTRERPVSFDSAGRVVAVTPPLAQRLHLAAPAWPVSGDFREARLYTTGDAFVLVVTRADGAIERFPLDAAGADALRGAVNAAFATRLSPSAEPGSDVLSEPAGFAFARNQLAVGLLVYGPALAALAGESGNPSAAAGAYMLGAGVPFFLALGRSRGEPITRAQNDLATDGGPRMALVSSAAYYALTGARDEAPYQGTILAGAIAGTIGGLKVGRGLTDGEAAAMTAGSTLLTGVTAGIMGVVGRFDERCRTRTSTGWGGTPYTYEECETRLGRADYGVLAATAMAGYPLGLQWVRRASYGITAGDVRATTTSGVVGALATAAFIPDDADARTAAAFLTAGLVTGVVAGDRLLARRFDYTRGQGAILGVGAVGGGLIGLALPALAQTDEGRVYLVAAGAGAITGMAITHGLLTPYRARAGRPLRDARLRPGTPGTESGRGAMRFQFDPGAAALALGGTPGHHSLVRLTF